MTAAASAAATPAAMRRERRFEVAFAPSADRVSEMRRITMAHLRLWRVPDDIAESVVLAVSELVTNAVVHGTGSVALCVRRSREEVRVDVTDGNVLPATLRCATSDDEGGRGLHLVAVLARDWGTTADGKTTWCVVRIPPGSP